MSEPFYEIEHSGDIGIQAHGRDEKELFRNATLGLFGLMYRGTVTAVVERTLSVTSSSREDLLVDWLSEVIAECGTRGELYGEVVIRYVDDRSLEGVLRGETADPDRHQLRFDVKAATYHELELRADRDGLHARVIFDL